MKQLGIPGIETVSIQAHLLLEAASLIAGIYDAYETDLAMAGRLRAAAGRPYAGRVGKRGPPPIEVVVVEAALLVEAATLIDGIDGADYADRSMAARLRAAAKP